VLFVLALLIALSNAQCPKCSNEPDHVCGVNEAASSYKWFVNRCHVTGWNCYNDEKFTIIDNQLCAKNLGELNEKNSF